MFICAVTGKAAPSKTPCTKVIVQTRPRDYLNEVPDPEDPWKRKIVASKGWEIVKEMNVSLEGLDILKGKASLTPAAAAKVNGNPFPSPGS